MFGGLEKRWQQADDIQDLERAGLDRGGSRLPMRPQFAFDQPCLHAVAS
jgi:hypothetical protein